MVERNGTRWRIENKTYKEKQGCVLSVWNGFFLRLNKEKTTYWTGKTNLRSLK